MKIKIMGFTYEIEIKECSDKIGALGRYHAASQTIQVANDLDLHQTLSTVIHEVIECINYHNNLDLNHTQISVLETCLFQVLNDNGVDLNPLLADE